MTKIDIISGFLGAGKTTLIKRLIKECYVGEQVVLIENEFGEIGIDGGFLKEAGIEIREMNSGCICCSLVGDFGEALKEVIAAYHPDRIVIEPSGVGKLSDVTKAVRSVEEETDIVINSLTTVVDVKKCKLYLRNFGEFFKNQVENARTVILSRTDIADEEKVQDAISVLIEYMGEGTRLVTTPIEKLTGAKLLAAMEETVSLEEELMHDHDCGCGHHHHGEHDHDCGCGHHHHGEHDHDCGCGHHHDHHAEEVFTSWGAETAKTFSRDEIGEILGKLSDSGEYGTVLRSKGMVEGDNGQWIYFDMVPEEIEVRSGEPEYTGRICVIGSKLEESRLQELFGL